MDDRKHLRMAENVYRWQKCLHMTGKVYGLQKMFMDDRKYSWMTQNAYR